MDMFRALKGGVWLRWSGWMSLCVDSERNSSKGLAGQPYEMLN